jgi:hypothetical protein
MSRQYPIGPYDYEEFFNGFESPTKPITIPPINIPQHGGHNPNSMQLQYDPIFQQIYALLVQFSEKIQQVKATSHYITLHLEALASNWSAFLKHFEEGAYFHYRCQGFVESLIITKEYTFTSVNVWVNQLVYPAASNFIEAMFHFEQLKLQNNLEHDTLLQHLDQQLNDFKKIARSIIDYANHLNTIGPDFKM